MARPRGGDRREVFVLAVCLALSGGLFAFARPDSGTLLRQLTTAILWPADRVRGFVEGVVGERAENERLRRELLLLRSLQLRGQLASEAQTAASLPTLDEALSRALVSARVVGTARGSRTGSSASINSAKICPVNSQRQS